MKMIVMEGTVRLKIAVAVPAADAARLSDEDLAKLADPETGRDIARSFAEGVKTSASEGYTVELVPDEESFSARVVEL